MPLEWAFDPILQILRITPVTTWPSTAVRRELLRELAAADVLRPETLLLVDLRAMTDENAPRWVEIQDWMAHRIEGYSLPRRRAFIAETPLQRGIGHQFTIAGEDQGFDVAVFEDEPAALAWLTSGR